MGIVISRKPPDGGSEVVARAIEELSPARTFSAESTIGGAVDLSLPLPVYRLRLDELAQGSGLPVEAEPSTWRYLMAPEAGSAAFADLRQEGGGAGRLTGVSQNANADRLLAAAHLAEEVAGSAADDVDVILIDIPGLKLSALRLGGPDPRYIAYLDGSGLFGEPMRPVGEKEFMSAIWRAAAGALELFPAAERSRGMAGG